MTSLPQSIIDRIRKPAPGFNLTAHLARSAEVRTFNLLGHVRERQPINVLHSTCEKVKREGRGVI